MTQRASNNRIYILELGRSQIMESRVGIMSSMREIGADSIVSMREIGADSIVGHVLAFSLDFSAAKARPKGEKGYLC